ncbi:MAG: nucleotide disphospho-sugar-binding domain-containing protein [Gammaproteobacteria bacterium]
MARIVIIPGTIRSKLITQVELAARLERAGFDIIVVAPPGGSVDEAGIQYIRAGLELDASPRERGRPARKTRVARREAAVAATDVDGFTNRLRKLGPDLVLIDIESHAEIMAAVQAGLRVGLINVFFNLWKHPRVPPVHVPVTPGVGMSGTRPGIEWTWLRYRIWRWLELRRSRWDGNDELARLEALAERLDYSLAREVDYYQGLLPYIYRRLPILNTNLLELDLPHKPHPNIRYVGPMTSVERPTFSTEEKSVAADIVRIAAESRDAGRKLLYCSFGAYFMGDDTAFLRRMIEAAATGGDWTVVLGLGRRHDPDDLGPLPEHVHAFGWAPQMVALERADAALIHGGMTTVYECLHFAVPMVTYPYDIFDQNGTAARVRYHGVGISSDWRRDTPSQIAAHIDRTLGDAAIQRRVATMRKHMERYRSEASLENAVAEILADTGGVGASRT